MIHLDWVKSLIHNFFNILLIRKKKKAAKPLFKK